MGLSPLLKYGLMLAAFLAFCAGLILYGEHRKQIEWDASITEQAVKTAEEMIAAARVTARIETKYIRIKGATKIVTEIQEKEVIRYVESPSQKCQLSTDFVSTFDGLSGLLDAGSDGLPPAALSTGAPAPGAQTALTDAEVLQAYQRAVQQLSDLWTAYAALSLKLFQCGGCDG